MKHKLYFDYRNLIICSYILVISMFMVSGCKTSDKNKIESVNQLNAENCVISVDAGSASANTAASQFPKAKLAYGNSISDAYLAVEQGKSDAFVYDRLYMEYALSSGSLDDLTIMNETLDTSDIAVGIAPGQEDLLKQVNAFIAQIKKDGTLDDMYNRWILNADKNMPDIEKPANPTRTLNVGTSGLVEPMNYFDSNQQLTGFDVELIKRMAVYLNADIHLEAMSFDALVASLESGKLDMVVSDLNVTEERKEVILMSDTYRVSQTSVMVKKDRLSSNYVNAITSVSQLSGKKIGIVQGSSYEQAVKDRIKGCQLISTASYADSIAELQSGKIEAYICDEPIAKYQIDQTEGIRVLDEMLTYDDYAFVLAKNNTKLQSELNQALSELKAEGVLDELKAEWVEGKGKQEIEKNPSADTSKGVLRVITAATQEPFSYIKDNELAGYDVELIHKIAEKLGYQVEITDTEFYSMITDITTGKYDVAIGCITVTKERAESVLFTDAVYNSGTVAIVKDNTNTSNTSFFDKVKKSFTRTFITENRWKLIVNGLKVTIELSIASIILGTIVGFLYSFPLRSRNKLVMRICNGISTVLGGLPILVILMVMYYIVFSKTLLPAVWVGIIAFTIDFANTVAGLLNTGIQAVDHGQQEAAEAMGYSKLQVFTKITFPQAAAQMKGQYNGAVVGLVKGTSIVGYITVQDLTKAGDIIRSRTYEAFFPLIVTAVIYFALSYLIVLVLQLIERKLEPKRRKREVKGVNINDIDS
ncbi:MAG: transporter substrate-binding domain-containing protein [Lachnospira sp.]